jgi:hypothetical protein
MLFVELRKTSAKNIFKRLAFCQKNIMTWMSVKGHEYHKHQLGGKNAKKWQ